jgi:hypothetical protein
MNRTQLTAAKHAARHSRIAHLLRTTCPYHPRVPKKL